MRLGTRITLGVMALVLACAGMITWWIRASHTAAELNEAARDLYSKEATGVFTDLHGKGLDLGDVAQGEVVVVTSWASWCPLCAQDLATINQVVGEHAEGEVHALAINRHESQEQAARYLLTVPELPKITYVLDTKDYYFGAVDGYAMPETLVYDRQGKIILHQRGNVSADELRSALTTALQN